MPVCPIQLSESKRQQLGSILLFLNLFISFLAQVLTFVSFYVKNKLGHRQILMIGYNIEDLSNLLLIVVYVLVGFHLPSSLILLFVADYKTRARLHAPLFIWLLVAIAVSIATVTFASLLIFKHRPDIDEAYRKGFTSSLNHYAANLSYRQEIDKIQIEGQCCGAYLYKEWFRIEWAPLDELNEPSLFDKSQYMNKKGQWLVPWAPWSCCNRTRHSQCDSVWYFVPHDQPQSRRKQLKAMVDEMEDRLEELQQGRLIRDADGNVLTEKEVVERIKKQGLNRIKREDKYNILEGIEKERLRKHGWNRMKREIVDRNELKENKKKQNIEVEKRIRKYGFNSTNREIYPYDAFDISSYNGVSKREIADKYCLAEEEGKEKGGIQKQYIIEKLKHYNEKKNRIWNRMEQDNYTKEEKREQIQLRKKIIIRNERKKENTNKYWLFKREAKRKDNDEKDEKASEQNIVRDTVRVGYREREEERMKIENDFYFVPMKASIRERQFNQIGCIEHLSMDVLKVISIVYVTLIVIWFIQIAILFLSRWLQTSLDLAKRWGDTQYTAPGYLFMNWPFTLGEGQTLQPPPEDPEALFNMNDCEEDILGGLGLGKLRDLYDLGMTGLSGEFDPAMVLDMAGGPVMDNLKKKLRNQMEKLPGGKTITEVMDKYGGGSTDDNENVIDGIDLTDYLDEMEDEENEEDEV